MNVSNRKPMKPFISTCTLTVIYQKHLPFVISILCPDLLLFLYIGFCVYFVLSSYQQQKLAEEYNRWCDANENASIARCKNLLAELASEVNKNVTDGVYMVPGGYKAYTADLQQVVSKYDATANRGIKVNLIKIEALSLK